MNNENNIINNRRGNLKYDFQLFHLKDQNKMEFEFHHHDFNKIIIFISGKVTYIIEGKSYRLRPWDILLVSNNEIHRPMIDPVETYERIVIWLKPSFLEKYICSGSNLLNCFENACDQKSNLIRLGPEIPRNITLILTELESSSKSNEFGSNILKEALFLQLMVYINRLYTNYPTIKTLIDVEYDPRLEAVLNYINDNLGRNLSIDSLSSKFFMSKYYLMHRFKTATGYSIYNYIQQKRLIWANSLIKEGKSITETSLECGFTDYSSFVKAFKKMFGMSPRNYYKNHL